MGTTELKDMYESNADFRRYMDQYCRKYQAGQPIPLEEALEHRLVKEVARMYRDENRQQDGNSTYTPAGECL